MQTLGLGCRCSFSLFVNVSRPGDSEGTFAVFESSYHRYYQGISLINQR